MTEKGRRGRRPTIFPEKPKASLCCCNAAQWKTQKPTPRTRGNESIPLSPLFLISVLPRCWEARWFAWLWAGSLRQECADIKLRMECRSAEAVVQSVVQIGTRQKEKEKKDIKVWSYERNRVHIRLGRAIRRRIAASQHAGAHARWTQHTLPRLRAWWRLRYTCRIVGSAAHVYGT